MFGPFDLFGIRKDYIELSHDKSSRWNHIVSCVFSETPIALMFTISETEFSKNYLSIKYIDKFCKTQKTPTQKSATAKLARKKFVIDRSRLDITTTKITNKLPVNEKENGIWKKRQIDGCSLIVNVIRSKWTVTLSSSVLMMWEFNCVATLA